MHCALSAHPRSFTAGRAMKAIPRPSSGSGADDDLGEEIARADTDEIAQRARMLENEIKVIKNEQMRLNHEHQAQKEKISFPRSKELLHLPCTLHRSPCDRRKTFFLGSSVNVQG